MFPQPLSPSPSQAHRVPPGSAKRRSPCPIHWIALTCLGFLATSARAGDWPGWRGVHRDGHLDREKLPVRLETAPQVLWRKSIGHGYAAPAAAGDTVVVLDDANGRETAHLLSTKTGTEVWTEPYHETYSDEFEPGPRCTPLIDGDRLYVQSCRGEFRCLNLADGKTRWRFHFADYGAFWVSEKGSPIGAANRRGHSGSPVISGDRIFVQVGSTNGASIAAFDKLSGRLLWKSQNDLTCYSSLNSGTLGGIPQVVGATCDGLLGLASADGVLLWRVPFKTGANRNVLTPILDGNTVTFGSYTTGLRRARIESSIAPQKPTDEWFNRDLKINLSTPTLAGEYFYGLGSDTMKSLMCVDRRTGKIAWTQPGFDAVASVVTDGERLLVLNDRGECLLLAADPNAFRELGRFQACGKTFVHPAFSNGILYVRDQRELIAYSLKH